MRLPGRRKLRHGDTVIMDDGQGPPTFWAVEWFDGRALYRLGLYETREEAVSRARKAGRFRGEVESS